jgi:putative transposase
LVIPRVPHHVTQRGNHRERVFFGSGDREFYLWLLNVYARQYGVEIYAYCLMTYHVHLVVVPADALTMQRALRAVHSQYAQRINRMAGRSGHLWQGRYFSSPLDSNYFLNAVRYVELNPVRAGLVEKAEDYEWSSAAAHCGRRHDNLLAPAASSPVLAGIRNWSGWLGDGLSAESVETIRHHGSRNLPCGSSDFVAALEQATGGSLNCRPRGRPWPQNANTKK